MLTKLLGAIWRRTPVRLKRWTMSFTNASFAVTAGAIISNDQGQVLLLKHRFRPGTGWGMPGGYINKGEQPDEALRRELREEVAMEVETIELFSTRAFSEPQQIEIVFCCEAVGEPGELNYEIEKFAWVDPNKLPPELPKDQAELIRRAFSDGARQQD